MSNYGSFSVVVVRSYGYTSVGNTSVGHGSVPCDNCCNCQKRKYSHFIACGIKIAVLICLIITFIMQGVVGFSSDWKSTALFYQTQTNSSDCNGTTYNFYPASNDIEYFTIMGAVSNDILFKWKDISSFDVESLPNTFQQAFVFAFIQAFFLIGFICTTCATISAFFWLLFEKARISKLLWIFKLIFVSIAAISMLIAASCLFALPSAFQQDIGGGWCDDRCQALQSTSCFQINSYFGSIVAGPGPGWSIIWACFALLFVPVILLSFFNNGLWKDDDE